MAIDFYSFTHDSDGKHTGYRNLISVRFKRLQMYRKEWSLEEIIIFEALLVLSKCFGSGKFFKQYKFLTEMTRLSEHKIRNALEKLCSYGFVTITRETETRKNFYEVRYDVIKNKIDIIYDFSDLNGIDTRGFKQLFRDFFDYHEVSGYYDDDSFLEHDEPPIPDEHVSSRKFKNLDH